LFQANENQTNPWQRVELRPYNGESFKRTTSYHIKNLEPATDYEAEVVSENRYGRSRVSDEFKFSTRSNGKSHNTPFSYSLPSTALILTCTHFFSELDINDLGLLARSNTSNGALLSISSSWAVFLLAAVTLRLRNTHCKSALFLHNE